MLHRLLTVAAAMLVLSWQCQAADVEPDLYLVGTARVDITPEQPIRLNGFGFRRTESEGINHRIHARAISIRHSGEDLPVVLMTVDVLGIPETIRNELAKRLNAKVKIPSERLAITATHTHCGPMLTGANPTIFGLPIPGEHQKHIDDYTIQFIDKLEAAALAALKEPLPSHLSWGVGSVTFAKNRRRQGGPSDHDLPVLVVRDTQSRQVRAIYTSYACHCVTLSHNKIGGDWAGYAAEALEIQHPGAVGLVSIGCGADQNPESGVTGDKIEIARMQGRAIAAEVQRLLAGYLAPIQGHSSSAEKTVTLPLAELPTRKEWEEKSKRDDAIGYHAKVQLARLDRNETLATKINYTIQTWSFGNSLAFVHLPGEVVVDYALRMKNELDRGRIWLTAYANANPCYIPSERVLKEGGYEGGGAMIYYDVPVPFKSGLEDTIVAEVKRQVVRQFQSVIDSKRTRGERPLSSQQSLATLKTESRFTVELAVAEPLVADPVAIAFGPDGKLWVAEMLDYPSGRQGKFEPGGRIRCIEQTDGQWNRATTFLDNLPFPTGVLPWRKGLLICAAPDILYAEDTNGDGKADVVRKLFSGFGTDNYQARVNGLTYGLDGWVYGSCGLFGGNILSHITGQTLPLGDRDFRINPDTGAIEPATGRTQQGRVRDDWGNWFGCDNSHLAFHYVLADHDLRRNPHVAPPSPLVHLMTGDATRLFPQRTVQLFQLSGPAGRPTAACGVGIYRDDRLGAEFTGNIFTCEPVNLLVHRSIVSPRGSSFEGTRSPTESDREFLTSDDPWFRPVQAITGPDGALWIADMYRFVIEHPRWIPAADLATLDVRAGAGLGRIYRVRSNNSVMHAWPRLDTLDVAALVNALETPNGWQRDMATEMLVWKNDRAAVALLKELMRQTALPSTRLHALVALDHLGGLTPEVMTRSLQDSSSAVRRHAVRLSGQFHNEDISREVIALINDENAQVRLQVAVSLGDRDHPLVADALATLARKHRNDPYLQAAVLSSLNRRNLAAFVARPDTASSLLLPKLIATAAGFNDDESMAALLIIITTSVEGRYQPWQFAGLRTYLDIVKAKERPAAVSTMIAAARTYALDRTAALDLRTAAVPLLGLDDLGSLLVPQTPGPLQAVAIKSLGQVDDPRVPALLLGPWPGYSPVLQGHVVETVLKREAWAMKFLTAISEGKVPASALAARDRQTLLTHPNTAVRKQAEKLFAGTLNADRNRVIDNYRTSLPKPGDAAKGRAVFLKTCSACHQLEGQGHAVGPDLAALATKTVDYFLVEILDPNRNMDNRYLEYRANTLDGRTITGLLATEAANAVTLRQADGQDVVLLRSDLESLKSTNRSLMPEGLEKDITPASMADLLAYLAVAHLPATNDPAMIAKYLLDDKQKAADREAMITRHADKSAAILQAMATGLVPGPEEYRRIPWLWRVAIAAGKRNQPEEIRAILEIALPHDGEPLRDWQAVVIGGGIINGVSQSGTFPGPRLLELSKRWPLALQAAATMAENTAIPMGTRYDALRMIPLLGWKSSGKQLEKYIAKGTHTELQMGAVSGLTDLDDPAATALLVAALDHLTAGNRTLALQGLLRTEARTTALLDAVESGRLKPAAIDSAVLDALKKSKSKSIRERSLKLLTP